MSTHSVNNINVHVNSQQPVDIKARCQQSQQLPPTKHAVNGVITSYHLKHFLTSISARHLPLPLRYFDRWDICNIWRQQNA